MAAEESTDSTCSASSFQAIKRKKSRQWTETELKYFALVLVDEKTEFAYKLDTLALKKTANKNVYEDISIELKEVMSGADFKEENQREIRSSKSKKGLLPLSIDADKLRTKFKWLKDQWRRYSDRIKKGSGKSPIQEPEWYTILNPVFSDTHGNLEVASKVSDVLSDDSDDSEVANSIDRDQLEDIDDDQEVDELNLTKTSNSGTGCEPPKKQMKKQNDIKPLPRRKRVRTQSQAINEIAKSFNTLGESQERRSELMIQAEQERHAEFIKFQREQAELNRQHELKMLEVIMKYSNNQQHLPPQQSPQHFQSQVQPTQFYSCAPFSQSTRHPYNQDMQGSETQKSNLLNLDEQNTHTPSWF